MYSALTLNMIGNYYQVAHAHLMPVRVLKTHEEGERGRIRHGKTV